MLPRSSRGRRPRGLPLDAQVRNVDGASLGAVQSHDPIPIVEVLNVQHLCRYPHVRGGAPTADC